ncbi:hypothetical protein B0H11DRAFT_2199424, partial [Mycena galericulata]
MPHSAARRFLDDVPLELIDGIMEEVRDTPSLKACALVATAFRAPSQRVLLQALTLDNSPATYLSAFRLLDESPHLVPYVRRLTMTLRWVLRAPESSIEIFRQVLVKLSNVRRLSVAGCCGWESLARVAPALQAFIQRNDIEVLCLQAYFPRPGNNAFLLFRKRFLRDHDVSAPRCSEMAAANSWKALTSRERTFWEMEAAIARKEEHTRRFPVYRFRPPPRHPGCQDFACRLLQGKAEKGVRLSIQCRVCSTPPSSMLFL